MAGRPIVVMGVSGSGKSTVGSAIAQALDCPFLEGDAFHPAANVAKMASGIPLDDEDRWPWLDALGAALGRAAHEQGQAVAACSALKRAYRDRLRAAAGGPILLICLGGERAILRERMQARIDHYMPASLLDSQLATLEPPAAEEGALMLDLDASPELLVSRALEFIRAAGQPGG